MLKAVIRKKSYKVGGRRANRMSKGREEGCVERK